MPMSYIIDQWKLLFLKKIRTSDNTVLWSFSIIIPVGLQSIVLMCSLFCLTSAQYFIIIFRKQPVFLSVNRGYI